MTSLPSTQLVLVTVACFFGGAVGSFLTTFAQVRDDRSAPISVDANPDSQSLSRELIGEIKQLRKELAERASARVTAAPDDRAAGAGRENDSATDRLRELIATLEQRAVAPASGGSIAELAKQPPSRGVEFLSRQMIGWEDEGLDVLAADQKLTDAHLLWSVREVVSHYGQPQKVEGGERGLVLSYNRNPDGRSFRFRISEGVVVAVNF